MTSEKQVEDGWDEERIAAKVREVSHNDMPDMRTRSVTEFQAQQLMGLVWSDCQRTIAALRETLEFAARYKSIEGRPCPLCKYENGVFIEACQMHKDMNALEAQLKEQAGWETVEYNDIINIDNSNQIRVVIGQGDNDKDKERPVHLHIRKRIDGEWKHIGITTILPEFRLQKRRTESEG